MMGIEKGKAYKVWVETYTGARFYVMQPTVEMVCIEDIAHSLSMICRYNGHTARFYSVAEHSCLLSDYVMDTKGTLSEILLALMHDAAEAYVGDIIWPFKECLPDFKVIEKRVEAVIADAFDLGGGHPTWLKSYDTRILVDEKEALMGNSKNVWASDSLESLGVPIQCWLPAQAEQEFLSRFALLTGRNK